MIGFVEGVILVSTPALMRDFSPQMGRGVAMGFWALGPTMGALSASLVATHTLDHLKPWQDQFIISGLVCLGVVVIAFFFLRELSPQLRDQLMVSERERALVEARAKGIDVETATAHPIRSMMRLDLISSSIAISVFLLFYYASVSVLTIYWVVIFNRSTPQANGINVWLRRLPLRGARPGRLPLGPGPGPQAVHALRGGGAMVMLGFLIVQTGHPHTGYYANVLVIVLLAVSIAIAYAPWMANYTEQVESHNPALTASGLAVWGWILRITVALSFLVLPYVITTSTVLVDNQTAATALQAIQAAEPYAPSTTALLQLGAGTGLGDQRSAGDRRGGPADAGHHPRCVQLDPQPDQGVDGGRRADQSPGPGPARLQPAGQGHSERPAGEPVRDHAKVGVHSQNLASLLVAEQKLVPAQKTSPGEWKRWWTVCLVGQFVFADPRLLHAGPLEPAGGPA